jgi:hypothetical protein
MPRHGDSEWDSRADGMQFFDGRFDRAASSRAVHGNYAIDVPCKFNFSIATIEIARAPISVA